MIADMRIAAAEDRDLNSAGKPATKKMGMLKVTYKKWIFRNQQITEYSH